MTDEEFLEFLNRPGADLGEVNPYSFFPQNFRYPRNTLTQNIPIATAQNPAMVNYDGIMGTDQANNFQFQTSAYEDDEEGDKEALKEDDEGGITKLLNFLNPLGFIQNMFGTPQPYQQFSPGTTIDSRGIVNVAGVSTPYNMFGGDFYNPNTGLNRFDRAKARYDKTGSTADLFASSRTGTEFFRKLRERKAAKQKATMEEASDLRERIDRGDFDRPSIPDRDIGSVTTQSAAKTSKVGGGGYTKADSARESYRGRY